MEKISLADIDAFVFDFDGVLTNNLVYINEQGIESVVCNRADGLAFDVLRKLNKPVYILSTEKNPVVIARAQKLQVNVLQAVDKKERALIDLAKKQGYKLQRIAYVGNDLNDFQVMQLPVFSVCPADSHKKIKDISDITLNSCGGQGVVRELLENVFELDFIEILYST